MDCRFCSERGVFNNYCKHHFIEYFEKTVANTIKEHGLMKKDDKVCVAASGGKDSLTTAFVLKKLGYDVRVLAIDEGIKGYRERTLEDLKFFCEEHNIGLKIVSFKQEFGMTLDELSRKIEKHPCTICGILRRYLINKHAAGCDVLATGHNADDEAQTILMNLFKAHPFFFKAGPKSGVSYHEGFIQRVKPLYFLTEKEVMIYAILNDIRTSFAECPNIEGSYRSRVRDAINEFLNVEEKKNILKKYLSLKKAIKEDEVTKPKSCSICGFPSSKSVCSACALLRELNKRVLSESSVTPEHGVVKTKN